MLQDILGAIQADPAGAIIVVAVAFALADFLTGVSRAIRMKAFDPRYLADWLQSHLLGRVMPIAGVALLGRFLAVEPLFAIAGLALATYVAEATVSIRDNLLVAKDA